MRLLVTMAVVAVLVWAIPMVFIGREQARRAETLAGGSGTVLPADEGHGVPSEVATGTAAGEAPTGPIGRANDVAAQSTLNAAIRVAQVYFAENGHDLKKLMEHIATSKAYQAKSMPIAKAW